MWLVFRYPQGSKEMPVCKIYTAFTGCLFKDAGKDLDTECSILEFTCNPRSSAKQIESGLRPII